jgi:hypothetical protein
MQTPRVQCRTTSRQLTVLIVEHTFDSNVMSIFMEDAANGRLRSGAVAQTAAVPATFFRQVLTLPMDVSTGAPPLPGGADYVRLFDRVMESLGSRTNEAYYVFAHYDINHVKSYVSLSSESDHAACNGQCLRYKLTRHFQTVDERSTPYQPKKHTPQGR